MSRTLLLTRVAPGTINSRGVETLRLSLVVDGVERDHVEALSGAPGRQVFRTLANERRGFLEPIPEGIYSVGPLEWAGRPGDYSTMWSEALGPVIAELYAARAIVLHLDGGAPGSAGCVCTVTMEGLRRVVSWFEAGQPTEMRVDWGLGSLPAPSTPGRVAKLFSRPEKTTLLVDGKPQPGVLLSLTHSNGAAALAINGRVRKILSAEVLLRFADE